jgi:Nuclease-related domain
MYANASLPGQSVRRGSRRLYEEAGWRALGSAALLALGVAIGAGGGGGAGAIVGAGLLVGNEARLRARSARRFKIGAIAEERVAARLWPLDERGWLVEHDIQKRGGGNVDHVVHSPAVTFVIDTKAGRWGERDLAQAHRHVDWAACRYGALREIVAVICVGASELPPALFDGVYVIGAPHLVDFLLDRG